MHRFSPVRVGGLILIMEGIFLEFLFRGILERDLMLAGFKLTVGGNFIEIRRLN